VHLKSTKTRGVNEGKGTWQAASKLPASPGVDPIKMCPVITMRNYFLQFYDGNPKAPLFQTMARPGTPLPRGAFTIQLRARLTLAARHLDSPINVTDYSGISWRKAGLSLLAGQVAVNFLADHGDHADIRSTREYTTQSIEERGNHGSALRLSKHEKRGGRKKKAMDGAQQAARLQAVGRRGTSAESKPTPPTPACIAVDVTCINRLCKD
jgi:hypothetical protein